MKFILSMQDLHDIWSREYRNKYINVVWDLNSGRVQTNGSADDGTNAWFSEQNYTNYDQTRMNGGRYKATILNTNVSTMLFELIETALIFEDTIEVY